MKTLEELQAMPDEELRVMCAELCGFEKHPEHKVWYMNSGGWNPKTSRIETLPNYPADLNACHEAENPIYNDPDRTHLWSNYLDALTDQCSPVLQNVEHSVRAAARQRTIALILTLQK